MLGAPNEVDIQDLLEVSSANLPCSYKILQDFATNSYLIDLWIWLEFTLLFKRIWNLVIHINLCILQWNIYSGIDSEAVWLTSPDGWNLNGKSTRQYETQCMDYNSNDKYICELQYKPHYLGISFVHFFQLMLRLLRSL